MLTGTFQSFSRDKIIQTDPIILIQRQTYQLEILLCDFILAEQMRLVYFDDDREERYATVKS